jgi:hypothetical protein
MDKRMIRWILVSGIVLFFAACKKETSTTPATANFSVYLTDTPDSIFSAMDINFLGIEIKQSNGDSEMVSARTQIYNVLNLTDGNVLLVSSGPVLASDSIVSVRLLFGTNNSVTVGSNIYPLQLAAGADQVAPVNIKLAANSNISLVIDLDVPQSITETGTQFFLSPSLRVVNNLTNGAIQGNLDVGVQGALISVTDGINTYSTYTNENGQFEVQAIPPGTYIVSVFPPAPYNSQATENVTVTAGNVTKISPFNIN